MRRKCLLCTYTYRWPSRPRRSRWAWQALCGKRARAATANFGGRADAVGLVRACVRACVLAAQEALCCVRRPPNDVRLPINLMPVT